MQADAYTPVVVDGEEMIIGRDLFWLKNISFKTVPEGYINQLPERRFSYEEYINLSDFMDSNPLYWNVALVTKTQELVSFCWGTFDPLDKMMHGVRVSTHPKFFSYKSSAVFESLVDCVKVLAREMGAEEIYLITSRHKSFMRKFGDMFRETKARVLEVL